MGFNAVQLLPVHLTQAPSYRFLLGIAKPKHCLASSRPNPICANPILRRRLLPPEPQTGLAFAVTVKLAVNFAVTIIFAVTFTVTVKLSVTFTFAVTGKIALTTAVTVKLAVNFSVTVKMANNFFCR